MKTSISVAMATYNGAKFISQQIDSILNQTIEISELVICDDCSKDDTRRILQEYVDKDSRIRIHFNEQNLGFKKNFEEAIKFCTSEYIALSDQDDIWIPEHLELLKKTYEENNCVLTCGNSFAADDDCRPTGFMSKPKTYYLSDDEDEQFLQVLYSIPIQGCTAFFKRELLKDYIPIPDTQQFHDQWLALVAITKGKIVFLKEGLLYYRTHLNNVTGGAEIGFKAKLNHLFHEKDNKFMKAQIVFNKDLDKFLLPENKKAILKEAMKYYKRITRRIGRFTAIPYFIKNYKLIYTTNTYKYLLPRFVVKFILHM